MTFKGNPPYLMGLRTIPPDAWEFDSWIPERGTNTFTEEGKLAAITFYNVLYYPEDKNIRDHYPT